MQPAQRIDDRAEMTGKGCLGGVISGTVMATVLFLMAPVGAEVVSVVAFLRKRRRYCTIQVIWVLNETSLKSDVRILAI